MSTCKFDHCGNVARYGPFGEAVACWHHAGDWPEVAPLLPPLGMGPLHSPTRREHRVGQATFVDRHIEVVRVDLGDGEAWYEARIALADGTDARATSRRPESAVAYLLVDVSAWMLAQLRKEMDK